MLFPPFEFFALATRATTLYTQAMLTPWAAWQSGPRILSGYAADMVPEEPSTTLYLPIFAGQDADLPEIKATAIRDFATDEGFDEYHICVVMCEDCGVEVESDVIDISKAALCASMRRMAPHAIGMFVVELRPRKQMSHSALREFAQRAATWFNDDVMVDDEIHVEARARHAA